MRKTHGLTKTRLHVTWSNMHARCSNPNNNRYKRYGGRGISVCAEWTGEQGFINFYNWSMKNGYSDDLTIDRKDNDGNYEPSNCCWATMEDQANNKSNNVMLEYNGEKMTIKQASIKFNIKRDILRERLRRGWDIKDALERPIIVSKRSPK